MRVTVTRWIRGSFQLLALPASVFLSSMALGAEGTQTVPQTDSTPTSNVPLPLVSSFPLQKASDGAFAATEIHPLSCQLDPAELRTGSQKPAFNAEIAGCVPANLDLPHSISSVQVAEFTPTFVPLPTCAELQSETEGGVQALTSTSRDDGNRKSGTQTAPQLGEIAMVRWEASGQLSNGGGKIPMSHGFTASACPTITWASSTAQDLSANPTKPAAGGASANVSHADSLESVSGKAYPTSTSSQVVGAVPTGVMKQLLVLAPSLDPVSAGDTYLAELDGLLQGQSNWLFGNEEIVDMAPREPEVATGSYLDELNSLASKNGHLADNTYQNTSFSQQNAVGEQSAEDPEHESNFPIMNSYETIAAAEECCTGNSGEKPLTDFFKPVAEISVTGLSTQPPSRSGDDIKELQRPEDKACQYMDNATPLAYLVSTRFGGLRPSRNTLKLCHNPLYYEDPNLERCGQSYGCMTTVVSVVHFSTAIAMTPFKMSQNCPRDCVQALPDCPTCHKFDNDVYCSDR